MVEPNYVLARSYRLVRQFLLHAVANIWFWTKFSSLLLFEWNNSLPYQTTSALKEKSHFAWKARKQLDKLIYLFSHYTFSFLYHNFWQSYVTVILKVKIHYSNIYHSFTEFYTKFKSSSVRKTSRIIIRDRYGGCESIYAPLYSLLFVQVFHISQIWYHFCHSVYFHTTAKIWYCENQTYTKRNKKRTTSFETKGMCKYLS